MIIDNIIRALIVTRNKPVWHCYCEQIVNQFGWYKDLVQLFYCAYNTPTEFLYSVQALN